jgi:5'-nucleotidase
VLILLSNDDGVLAPGLAALHRAMRGLGDLRVVAPASGASASAHSITIDYPVICQQIHVGEDFYAHSVQGQPADCVKLAIRTLLPRRPDLVVSGINAGENVGIHVLYSGTVAAAAEGALLGCPAVAVSLQSSSEMNFERAGRLARVVVERILETSPQAGWLFNVNIPALRPGWPRGIRVARQSTLPLDDHFERRQDPTGRDYYWLRGGFVSSQDEQETDLQAVREGYIAVTPLRFDLTDEPRLAEMRSWRWTMPDGVA